MKYLTIILFIILFVFYYLLSFGYTEYSQTILTVSTFLFSVFTGFFIARQGKRYSSIREQIANFNGEISSIYRQSGHLGIKVQDKIKQIIKNHHKIILEKKAWDYHFVNKSNTITSIHKIIEDSQAKKALKSLEHLTVQRILTGLEHLQIARKNLVALHKERIPKLQWTLIYLLTVILFLSLSVIPSQYYILESLLKSAFGTSIVAVLVLLYRFDQLKFFEGTIGERTSQDILDILSGKK